MKDNTKIVEQYLANKIQVLDLLESLGKKIEDLEDLLSPEEIDYGHVGDLAHIRTVLSSLVELEKYVK